MEGQRPPEDDRSAVLAVVGRVSRFTGVTTSVVAAVVAAVALVAIAVALILSL